MIQTTFKKTLPKNYNMKLLQLQAKEDIGFINSIIYQDLVTKFNNLFIRKEIKDKPVFKSPVLRENSEFYKRLVELVGTGTRTKATILYITDTGVLVNNDPVVSLTVRFYNNKNKIQEIAAKTVVAKIGIPKVADTISIAYNNCYPDIIAVL